MAAGLAVLALRVTRMKDELSVRILVLEMGCTLRGMSESVLGAGKIWSFSSKCAGCSVGVRMLE